MYVSSSWAPPCWCGFDPGTHVRTADPTAGMMRVGQVESRAPGTEREVKKQKGLEPGRGGWVVGWIRVSWGGGWATGSAYVACLVRRSRRGEGCAYVGVCHSIWMLAASLRTHAESTDKSNKPTRLFSNICERRWTVGGGGLIEGSTGTRECRVRFCQMSSKISGSGTQVVEVLLERGG